MDTKKLCHSLNEFTNITNFVLSQIADPSRFHFLYDDLSVSVDYLSVVYLFVVLTFIGIVYLIPRFEKILLLKEFVNIIDLIDNIRHL